LKQWLKTANSRDIAGKINSFGNRKTGTSTLAIPFKKSIKKTVIPMAFELVISNEFIAPTLPEPSLVISIPLVFLRKIKAVGKDPSKYPIAELNKYSIKIRF
jgi:hypothetical protein